MYEGALGYRDGSEIPDPSQLSLTPEQIGTYNEHIQKLMAALGRPNMNGPLVRAIDQRLMMQAQNGGFPKTMYHAKPGIKPQEVYNGDQERVLAERGYSATYIFHEYPLMLCRRNYTVDRNGDPRYEDSVETKSVNDARERDQLLEEPETHLTSRWSLKYDQLPPLPGNEEDKDITIARLEGELVARREQPPANGQTTRGRKEPQVAYENYPKG